MKITDKCYDLIVLVNKPSDNYLADKSNEKINLN